MDNHQFEQVCSPSVTGPGIPKDTSSTSSNDSCLEHMSFCENLQEPPKSHGLSMFNIAFCILFRNHLRGYRKNVVDLVHFKRPSPWCHHLLPCHAGLPHRNWPGRSWCTNCDRAPPAVGDQKRSPSAASRTHDKACFGKRRGGEVSGPCTFWGKEVGIEICTLWWTNIAMENHHFSWENPL